MADGCTCIANKPVTGFSQQMGKMAALSSSTGDTSASDSSRPSDFIHSPPEHDRAPDIICRCTDVRGTERECYAQKPPQPVGKHPIAQRQDRPSRSRFGKALNLHKNRTLSDNYVARVPLEQIDFGLLSNDTVDSLKLIERYITGLFGGWGMFTTPVPITLSLSDRLTMRAQLLRSSDTSLPRWLTKLPILRHSSCLTSNKSPKAILKKVSRNSPNHARQFVRY